MTNVCFVLGDQYTGSFEHEHMERLYDSVFKRITVLLYAHPKWTWAFYLTGLQLDWIVKYHPECIDIFSELTSRKQIELLGGGYYEPLLPLLLPRDRAGQIELMTKTLRQAVGKRPRGAKLICDVWDPSLISCFTAASIEYILVDSSVVPETAPHHRPLIAEDHGKSLFILPERSELLPNAGESPEHWFERLAGTAGSSVSGNAAVCRFDTGMMKGLLDSGWMERMGRILNKGNERCVSMLPSKYIRSAASAVPVYIPPGMNGELARYSVVPFRKVPADMIKGRKPSIQEFLFTYPGCRAFYARMIQTSIQIYQCRGDRARKKAAYEKLWEAQSGAAGLFFGKLGMPAAKQRADAFRCLMLADRFVRESGGNRETAPICYDMNADGKLEYIFKHEKYTAGITQQGGGLFILDIQNTGCCSASMVRCAAMDGVSDEYPRDLFVDHLMDPADLDKYVLGQVVPDTAFSRCVYRQRSFNSLRRNLELAALGYFGTGGQRVSLKKSYVSFSDGLQVRFVLTNEDEHPLHAVFATELSFELPAGKETEFVTEILSGVDMEFCGEVPVLGDPVRYPDVSVVRLSNEANNVSFVFEPNERVGYCQFLLSFSRPQDCYVSGDDVLEKQPAGHSISCTFYWPAELEPRHAVEKTLTMGITVPPKRRRGH